MCDGLADGERQVTLASIDESLAQEMAYAERVMWRRRCYRLGIRTRFDQRLARVERAGNRLRATLVNTLTDEPWILEVD